MVNQICIVGVVQGLLEGLYFVKCVGFDLELVIGVIFKGVVQFWQMENCWEMMVVGKFDYGFVIDWMCKDFCIIFEEVCCNGVRLLVIVQVDQFYGDVQDMGGNCWDMFSLIVCLEKLGE